MTCDGVDLPAQAAVSNLARTPWRVRAAAISNTTFFEFPHDPPAFPASTYQQTLKEPLVVKDGMVRLPQSPGLGVELQDWIFG